MVLYCLIRITDGEDKLKLIYVLGLHLDLEEKKRSRRQDEGSKREEME